MNTQVSNHWELSASRQCRKFLVLIAPINRNQPKDLRSSDFLTSEEMQILASFDKNQNGNWSLKNVHQTFTLFDWNQTKSHQQIGSCIQPSTTSELFVKVNDFMNQDESQSNSDSTPKTAQFLFADLQALNFPHLAKATPHSDPLPLTLSAEHNNLAMCSLIANLQFKLEHVYHTALVVLLKFSDTQSLWPTLLVTGDLEKHPLFAKQDLLAFNLPHEVSKIPNIIAACQAVYEGLTGFYLPDLQKLGSAMQRLTRVISCLRGPQGCPWDISQSTKSLIPFMIEEAYEAIEAAEHWVSGQDPSGAQFCDELGDVLLQILLNAQIASECKAFDLYTVVQGLTEKMIRRHPHVFETETSKDHLSSAQISDASEVKTLWDRVKATEQEKNDNTKHDLLHKALKKRSLPTLEYVSEISSRASKLGFCWQTIEDVWQDVESEIAELKTEIFAINRNWDNIEDELGDVVFALANTLVHFKQKMNGPDELSFDTAARKSAAKFVTRFKEMQTLYFEETKAPLSESIAKTLDLNTWNTLWSHAKKRRYR